MLNRSFCKIPPGYFALLLTIPTKQAILKGEFSNIFFRNGGNVMNRLEGKVAVITGGNSGVGAATAKLFAAEGATVVITARREAALTSVAKEITEAGGKVMAVSTDISKKGDPEKLMDTVMEVFGHIDILINNAGIPEEGLKPIDRFSDEDLDPHC